VVLEVEGKVIALDQGSLFMLGAIVWVEGWLIWSRSMTLVLVVGSEYMLVQLLSVAAIHVCSLSRSFLGSKYLPVTRTIVAIDALDTKPDFLSIRVYLGLGTTRSMGLAF